MIAREGLRCVVHTISVSLIDGVQGAIAIQCLVHQNGESDRTQVATIALAASHHPFGVAAGAILGHAVCAAIAVIGGCLVAGRISERSITVLGGVSFLLFAGVALIELR